MKAHILLVTATAIAAAMPARAQQPTHQAPSTASGVGYKSVAEALAAVRDRPGAHVTLTQPDGWTIVAFDGRLTEVWSFTPSAHEAHPAVVRRALVEDDGAIRVQTRALCHAAKDACDRLLAEFARMNERMRENVQQRLGTKE